jgi:hypothetical protein
MSSRIDPAVGHFDKIVKTCRSLQAQNFMARCAPIGFSKKAMFLVDWSVHNLSPDDIWFSENVEETDIFA